MMHVLKVILIIYSTSCISHLFGGSFFKASPPPPIVLHVNVNQSNSNDATNTTMSAQNTDQSQVTAVKQDQANNNNAAKSSSAFFKGLSKWISNHKFLLCMSAAGCGYMYARTKINNFKAYLRDTTRWSAWKLHLSLEQLMAQPAHAQELLRDAHLKYINAASFTDIYAPISSFFKALDDEETLINNFLSLTRHLKKLRLARFFPYKEETIKDAQNCLSRIRYLRAIIAIFFADHNYTLFMQAISPHTN